MNEVLEKKLLPTDSGIEAMPHDFFAPQPIKGAKAYFLHSVLHDWPDDKCKEIVQHIAAAMEKGYSKLLINDNVMPDRGAHWVATGLNLFMMTVFTGNERKGAQWRSLLEDVGLKVNNMWLWEGGVEGVVEAELA